MDPSIYKVPQRPWMPIEPQVTVSPAIYDTGYPQLEGNAGVLDLSLKKIQVSEIKMEPQTREPSPEPMPVTSNVSRPSSVKTPTNTCSTISSPLFTTTQTSLPLHTDTISVPQVVAVHPTIIRPPENISSLHSPTILPFQVQLPYSHPPYLHPHMYQTPTSPLRGDYIHMPQNSPEFQSGSESSSNSTLSPTQSHTFHPVAMPVRSDGTPPVNFPVTSVQNQGKKHVRPFKNIKIPVMDENYEEFKQKELTKQESYRQCKKSQKNTKRTSSPQPSTSVGSANCEKDEAYRERRRKNNEAAKRSRDARRRKEDELALRTAFLEAENAKLKGQLNWYESSRSIYHILPNDYISKFK